MTLAAAGDYQVVVTTASSCGDTLVLPVTVNVQPVVGAITGGGNYCSGDDVTLTSMNTSLGVASVTYTWTGPNGFTATGTALGTDSFSVTIPGMTAAESGTYTLSLVSDLGCSSNNATVDVIVQPTPVMQVVSGSGAACENGDITFSAINTDSTVVSMTCTWTGSNGFFSQQVVNGTDTVALTLTNISMAMAGDYTLVCDNNGCTSAPLTFNLQVNATPEINGTSPNGDFCAGTNITLTAMNVVAGTGDIVYTWTGPNGYLFTALAANPLGPFDAPVLNIDSTNAGIYTLVLETAGGCQSVPQSVTIGILPTPEICNVSGGGDACVGQTMTLSAENCTPNIGPIIYTWTGPNGIAGAGVSNDNGPFEAVLDNIQLTDAGTYCLTLQSADFGCVSQQICVDVNVFMGLNIIEITPDSTYCEGTDVTLSATNSVAAGDIIYTWTGPNSFSFTDTVPSIDPLAVVLPSITVSDSGQYILTLTSTAGCTTTPDSVLVDVVPGVHNLNLTGAGNYCEGTAAELVATAESSASVLIFTWTNEAGDTIQVDTLPPPGPSVLSFAQAVEGVYTVTVSTPDGCDATTSALIGVTLLPNIIDINTDTSLCELDGLLLCGQNGNAALTTFDYTWVTPSGGIITGVGHDTAVFCDLIEPLATFGGGLYTLVLSNEGCTDVDSFFLDLNPNPVISSIAGGGTYCEGDPVQLTVWNTNPAVDSVIVTCQLPDGTVVVDTVGGLDTITIVVTESGTVCCSMVTFFGCESSQACTEVTIEPNTDPVVPDSMFVCADESLELTGTNNVPGTGTVNYTWTGPNGFTFTGTAPWTGPFPATDPNPATGDYCLSITTSTGCVSNEACTYVTVNPVPEITDGINGGGIYCDNETATLTATVAIADGSDMTYEWTLDGNPVETGTAASGETLSLVATASGTYCLNLTSAEGCTSAPNCTDVTINATPEILEVTGGGVYCEGESVVLSGTGTPGAGDVTWIWTGPEGFEVSGTAPSEGPFTTTITGITPAQAGDYTLTLMLGDCVSDPATVTIEVNPMPLITNAIGGGSFCQGELVTIMFTIDPNGANSVDYSITGPGANETGTVTEVTTVTIEISVDPSTAGTYTMMAVSDAGCEANPDFVLISVREIDPATIEASATILCLGDELQLITNEQVGQNITYEWYKDGQLIGTTTVPVLDVPEPTSGEYTVVALVDGCSSTSTPVQVNVETAPVANDDFFSGNLNEPLSGNILSNDDASGTVTITLLSQPASGNVTVDASGNINYTPDNNFVGNDQFDYQICLDDCPDLCDQATVFINVSTDVCGVPNVLTINGDGINDILEILCLRGGDFPDNSLRIFNRWGDEIFVAEPYLNDWNGTYGNDKKELPAGTYFYLFKLDKNKSEFQAGYIKVVK
ncbi:MAG: gliding motility-associated C-terminal domain-containing protein [Saprospiraceae bacterium]